MREADTGVDTETRESGCSCPQLTFQADTGPSARCPLTLLFHPGSSFPLQPLFLMAGAGVSDSPSFLVLGMVFSMSYLPGQEERKKKKKSLCHLEDRHICPKTVPVGGLGPCGPLLSCGHSFKKVTDAGCKAGLLACLIPRLLGAEGWGVLWPVGLSAFPH